MRKAKCVTMYIPLDILNYLGVFMPLCIEGLRSDSEDAIDPMIPRGSKEFAAAFMLSAFYDFHWMYGPLERTGRQLPITALFNTVDEITGAGEHVRESARRI